MKIRYAPLAVACALMMAATATTTAQAAAVTYYFGGKLEGVDTGLPSLSVGNSFSGSFTFESTALDAFPDSAFGIYDAGVTIGVTLNGYSFFSASNCTTCSVVQVGNNVTGSDHFFVYSDIDTNVMPVTGPNLNGLSPFALNITLRDTSGAVFSSDALSSNLALTSFDDQHFLIAFGDRNNGLPSATGSLTYLSTTAPLPVPEASTSAMLALGLGALAVVRRRKDR